MSRTIAVSTALTAPVIALMVAMPVPADAAEKLVLQLHREAQFEFAGYYAALWQGFYRDAGFDVEIRPGSRPGDPNPADPVREVTEGRARFGTGTAQLLMRAAQGMPLLLLAPVFQRSGAAVYYRADSDFSSPAALLAGRVGRLPASNILDLELRTALKSEAIDPDRLRSLSIEPGEGLIELADSRVDAVLGSAWELPWQAHEKRVALKSFDPASYRAELYGDSLFTLQRLARAAPATVQQFREASLKGWDYALLHSGEIAARIVAELPVQVPVSDPAGFARYQSEIARRLARYPDVPLGHSNPERWSRIQQSLIEIGAISRPVDLDTFLYERGAEARNGGGGRDATLILSATGAGALLVITGLLWRRRLHAVLTQAAFTSFDKPAGKSPGQQRRPVADRFAALRSRMRPHALPQLRLTQLGAAALPASAWLLACARRFAASRGGAEASPRPTDLNPTLTALDRLIRRRLPGSVNFRLSLLPDLWLCDTEADAVKAATLALVAAAVTDMPAGGDLIVGTRQYTIDDAASAELPGSAPGDYVRLTVKDNGAGLSAERLDHILDPATTTRSAVVAAAEAARRLGGFARVESAEGIGTAVHLYFRRVVITSGAGAQLPPEADAPGQIRAAG